MAMEMINQLMRWRSPLLKTFPSTEFEQMYHDEDVDSIFSAVKKIKHRRGLKKRRARFGY